VITQSETGLYADVAGMALIFSWLNVLYENLFLRSVRLKTLCGARTRALHGRNGEPELRTDAIHRLRDPLLSARRLETAERGWRRRRRRRETRRTSRSFPPMSSTLSSRERTRTGERCCTSPPRLVRAPGDAQRKISLLQPSSAVPIPRTAVPDVDDSSEPPRASLPPSPSGRTELVELFLAHPTGRAAVNKGDEVSPRKRGAL